jgi:hypothetical protein
VLAVGERPPPPPRRLRPPLNEGIVALPEKVFVAGKVFVANKVFVTGKVFVAGKPGAAFALCAVYSREYWLLQLSGFRTYESVPTTVAERSPSSLFLIDCSL